MRVRVWFVSIWICRRHLLPAALLLFLLHYGWMDGDPYTYNALLVYPHISHPPLYPHSPHSPQRYVFFISTRTSHTASALHSPPRIKILTSTHPHPFHTHIHPFHSAPQSGYTSAKAGCCIWKPVGWCEVGRVS